MRTDWQILAVIGPTASGKSALAHAIALQFGAEILCVDSMTVYRGMDIGTAKPSADERLAVRHHLLDVADPTERFNVADFVERADEAIRDIAARGRRVVCVGGTPMYFKALFHGLFEGPGTDTALRERLSQEPPETLHQKLQQVDPAAAARIHRNDQRRLLRALEVFELTGKPISSFQTHWAAEDATGPGDTPLPRRHDATWLGLLWEKDALNMRINARARQMFAAGWVEEVRRLLERYGELGPTASEAAGYTAIAEHLRGRLSLDEAVEQVKIGTRQLARRQVKWFRRFPGVRWIDGTLPLEAQLQAAHLSQPPSPA